MTVGAATAWLAVPLVGAGHIEPIHAWVFLVVGGLFALLPDIDHPKSKIQFLLKGIFRPIAYMVQHRGFFHSVLAMAIIFGVSTALGAGRFHPALPYIMTAGYASHTVIDMLTPGGVRVLWPIRKKFRWLPRKIAPKTGGVVDYLLLVLASAAIVAFGRTFLL